MRGWGTSVETLVTLAIALCAQGEPAVRKTFYPSRFPPLLPRNSLTQPCTDAEALQVTFDPSVVTYNTLLEFFYRMHDPTTKDRQGGDAGTQYRSAIFYHSLEQEQMAKSVTEKVQKQWWKAGKITTEILEAGTWWDAEAYHQLYLDKVRRFA